MWSPERQNGNTKIIGPAYTVQYVSLNDTTSPKCDSHYVRSRPSISRLSSFHILTHHAQKIDSIPSGAVVFISSPKTLNAVYGGLMSNRAQASGAAGTVVDGRVRDLQEHRGLGYPVKAHKILCYCAKFYNASTDH